MHDLVHELARSVSVEEVVIRDANRGNFGTENDNYRYMLLSNFKDGILECKHMPLKARAIHFEDCKGSKPSENAFSKAKWLRVLDFSGVQIDKLPESMKKLCHLQVLNLSENACLKELHDFLCDLQKLHYLNLHGCSNLRKLPEHVHKLKDLLHLDLSGCYCLQKLPSEFGKLQKLSFLDLSCCSQLEVLPDSFDQLENLEYLNLSSCDQLKQLYTRSFKRMKELLYLNMSGCTSLEALPEFCGDNGGCLSLEILDLSDCIQLTSLSESCARLHKLRFLSLSGCSRIQDIIRFLGKFAELEYLNLSGVALSGFDGSPYSEAPTSSAGHSSGYSGKDMSLKMLNGVIKSMPRLEYLSAGGLSLFSKEGISEEFLTLPDFVVSARSGANSSNITLLKNILDPTHRELNIRCLEAVMSAEEAATVELGRKHRLASLSLEWSSSEWYTPSEPTVKTMSVLDHLEPHRYLKHLTIKGYNHSEVPRWIMEISDTLPNLVKLVLSDLVWCDYLPSPANLSNLEELEIRNMPRLKGACLTACKSLKRLSLVALASGFTLRFTQETSRGCQGIHEMESGHAEEPETPEVARTKSGVSRLLAALGFQRKACMSEVRASSSAPSATKEAAPILCSLTIEYCQDLKLYPSINFEEYFINDSKIEFITDTGSSAPILARKMHFKNCSHPTARLLRGVNIRTDELVLDGCDNEFFNHFFIKSMKQHYGSFDLQKKYEAIQKLKIIGSEKCYHEYLLCIPSLQELEIVCIDENHRYCNGMGHFQNLRRMHKLKKITLLSTSKSCRYTEFDSGEHLLSAIPHIQYIKINEAIYSADFHLLQQNRDFGVTKLCLVNLQLVKKANEVDPGKLGRFDQLCRLSLRWSRQPDDQIDTDGSAVLQRLQPHANLSALEIRGYQGAKFCAWLSNANLYVPNLVKIELVGMPRCERLPSLGQLANLEELRISDMPNIREVDTSFYGGKHPFRKLKKLHLDRMGNLEVWFTNLDPSAGQMSWNDDEWRLLGDEIFPSLKHLVVRGCPRLTLESGFQGCIRRVIESCSELSISPEEITADAAVLQVGFSDNIEPLQYLVVECATFHARMSPANLYLPNLVKIELVGTPTCERLPSLGQLANLEELHISDMHNIQEVDTSFYGGKHPFRKLKKFHINGMKNLEVWSANLEPSAGQMPWNDDEQRSQADEIFPCLKHLVVKGCPRLTLDSGFQGCIKRIIGSCSDVKLSPRIFFGYSLFSRLEVETNIFGFSDGSELLRYSINLNNLTIKSNSDLTTLPGTIKNCRTLRSLQILDCWNFSVLPDWLGDLTSLEELEVHAPKLQCLPHAIKSLTSLKTLTLKQCNYKLRERCSISGEDYDKIEHIKHHVQEGHEVSISSLSDVALLGKTTSHRLIELNIKDLQNLSSLKAEKINLVGKEELQLLSLEWSSSCGMIDNVVLEELQPHQNLRRLFIKNYPIDAGFPRWMQSLPNLLVSMELSNVRAGHIHLDHLQNLVDLHVSSFSSVSELIDYSSYNTKRLEHARSLLRISSTQSHKNLRRVTVERAGKLVWESSCLSSENLFPGLEYLEINCCLGVTFKPSIPKSSRYIISGSKQRPWVFEWPSFNQVMGRSTSASSSKMEIKYSEKLSEKLLSSAGLLDSLRQLDNEELTIDTCTDPVPLPECIQGWKSLRKLEILNCENMKTLPEWLGDMASLRELRVETYWMKTLPPCIERLTSLQALALLKCTKRFKQRCSEGGDDWSKIKHIENLIVEEMKGISVF